MLFLTTLVCPCLAADIIGIQDKPGISNPKSGISEQNLVLHRSVNLVFQLLYYVLYCETRFNGEIPMISTEKPGFAEKNLIYQTKQGLSNRKTRFCELVCIWLVIGDNSQEISC